MSALRLDPFYPVLPDADWVARIAAEGAGSSQTPARALIQQDPPSPDAGEITDKGYINQRAVLSLRSADVAALYESSDPRVIRP